jgi:hypothetical protein
VTALPSLSRCFCVPVFMPTSRMIGVAVSGITIHWRLFSGYLFLGALRTSWSSI